MSGKTTPLAPLTDHSYWRRLLAVAHPDRNDGDGELFVFLTALKEHVQECATLEPALDSSRRREGSTCRPTQYAQYAQDPDRVPYDSALGAEGEFYMLTHRALSIGQSVEEPYRSLLLLLLDCGATDHGRRYDQQARGASYKQLAYIGHLGPGLDKAERSRWYEICREIPLSEAHAGHIISSLKRQAKGRAA